MIFISLNSEFGFIEAKSIAKEKQLDNLFEQTDNNIQSNLTINHPLETAVICNEAEDEVTEKINLIEVNKSLDLNDRQTV